MATDGVELEAVAVVVLLLLTLVVIVALVVTTDAVTVLLVVVVVAVGEVTAGLFEVEEEELAGKGTWVMDRSSKVI